MSGWDRLRDYLQEEMTHRGWTQLDLAKAADVGQRTISRLMNGAGKRPPNRVAGVERALGWPPGTVRRIVFEGASPPERKAADGGHPRFADKNLQRMWEANALLPEHIRLDQIRLMIGEFEIQQKPYDKRGLHGERWWEDEDAESTARESRPNR